MKTMLISATLLLMTCAAVAQCKPGDVKDVTETRDTWVKEWNAKHIENVAKLYAMEAFYLPSDGTRVTGQSEIRAAFEKLSDSTVAVRSTSLSCVGDVAYDTGSYTQDLPSETLTGGATGSGSKRIEGSYLVVLKHQQGKWLIVAHASTAKP
jgi:uncharacterized protein (TIGR02246 family)